MTMRERIGVGILVLVGGFASACSTATHVSRGDDLMQRGAFREAEVEYLMAADADPGDAEIAAKIRQARVSGLFQKAQRLHFAGELMTANELFHEIARLAPESESARDWLKKSERDISRNLAQQGKDHLGLREYEAAIVAFEKALEYDPDNEDARSALARAKTILKWRSEKGMELWKTGLLEGTQGHPEIAATFVENSLDLVKDQPNAEEYLADLRTQMGEQRYRLAADLEASGQWHGAAHQYRSAKTLRADVKDIDSSIDKMDGEVKADDKVRLGRLALAKERFALATKLFEQAKSLTKNAENVAAIDAFLAEVSEKRSASLYRDARDLEMQGLIEEAIEAYRSLDKEFVAYGDARERVDRLQSRVLAPAKEAYDKALEKEKEGDLAGARALLKNVLFLHPFFRDARARLRKIETAMGERR